MATFVCKGEPNLPFLKVIFSKTSSEFQMILFQPGFFQPPKIRKNSNFWAGFSSKIKPPRCFKPWPSHLSPNLWVRVTWIHSPSLKKRTPAELPKTPSFPRTKTNQKTQPSREWGKARHGATDHGWGACERRALYGGHSGHGLEHLTLGHALQRDTHFFTLNLNDNKSFSW